MLPHPVGESGGHNGAVTARGRRAQTCSSASSREGWGLTAWDRGSKERGPPPCPDPLLEPQGRARGTGRGIRVGAREQGTRCGGEGMCVGPGDPEKSGVLTWNGRVAWPSAKPLVFRGTC